MFVSPGNAAVFQVSFCYFFLRLPHLAVGQVVDLLADVGDVGLGFVMRGAAGNVAVRLGQAQDGALQTNVDGVGQGGVVHLRVVAVDLIHPTLPRGEEENQSQFFFSFSSFYDLSGLFWHVFEDCCVGLVLAYLVSDKKP